MEERIYLTVKLIVSAYMIYKVWIILFRYKLFGLWKMIFFYPFKASPPIQDEPIMMDEFPDVIGRTTSVYLEDPALAATVPVRSEKLVPSGFIGEETDIQDEDVESSLSSEPMTIDELREELERFEVQDDLAPGLDPDFSSGITYEQMSNAVEVLTVFTDNEPRIIEAAKTIHSIKDSDLFEFFTSQVSNLENVEKLLDDCLGDDGIPLPVRRSKQNDNKLNGFNLADYV